jgi:glycine/D-amino acid oxidase-like deaminating enzyme
MSETADVVICGAGIAGVATAYMLAERHGITDVVLIDRRAPLSLTSDKSNECYRNWFPGPGSDMVQLMNRSIDIIEDIDQRNHGRFNINRRGYVFATAREEMAEQFVQRALDQQALGSGPARVHRQLDGNYEPAEAEGYLDRLTGADVLVGSDLIQRHFPYLSPDTVGLLHTRRCGWFSAQQYGQHLLAEARRKGVRLIRGDMTSIGTEAGRIQAIDVETIGGRTTIETANLVLAAGPYQKSLAAQIGIDLPVFCELHIKAAFNDSQSTLDRAAPLLIWEDPLYLPWDIDEQGEIAADSDMAWLLERFPAGVHVRPEGTGNSKTLILQWTYDLAPREPVFPLPRLPFYFDVCLRGMAVPIPGLQAYFERADKPFIDGGYYCKTRENRPLIGPLPVDGAFIIGALSGFGMQSSSAAAELLAAHIAGTDLPVYEQAFRLERYEDPQYLAVIDAIGSQSGQI